ncbi:Holliday junction resolvase RuvX [Roseivirga echinicomitans]|uniref:Putative pre-16S rRNA nuclease n=1 Tax=Roseivirga echinicomitans TaxID=296218 RepID=A0A150X1C1_9BACT|nr:Holliday junction resolvase RuvX [Roseivirga echinicomitans]KYG72476.1 crossover junction endodeoxyribonuclease RuvA [Roseivirga echinicomitans]
MGRILAIDYGSKRVGMAVTDPLQIIASPLDTVHSKDVIQYLKDYDKAENIESFVLGMPMNLNNQPTDATLGAQQFENLLKKQFPEKDVYLQDERFTSKMAMDAMIAGGMKKKDRREKGNIDKISATIILQSFLESR